MASLIEVNYLFRDASNYKFRGDFRLLGKISIDEIESYLFEGEFFIPEKIGLPPLRPETANEDDHLLHSIEDWRAVEGATYLMTAHEFQRRLREASQRGWF
jgi:hypothetical protein